MKKILYLLLMLFVWTSCSKEDERVVPVDGQYVADLYFYSEFDGEPLGCDTFVVVLENGVCTNIIGYFDGEKRFDCQPDQIVTKGKYPNYEYSVEYTIEYSTDHSTGMKALDWDMQAHFDDQDVFFAVFSGEGYSKETAGNGIDIELGIPETKECSWGIKITEPQKFKLDNRVLDANGDGILDSWQ